MIAWRLILTCVLWLPAMAVVASPLALPRGKTSFEFADHKGDPTRPVIVWMYVPDACDIQCPLQFVMHGVKRNGEEYLDNWVELAKVRRFIVIAPEFQRKHFPRDDDYSLGRTIAEADPAKWVFAVPEHLFDALKDRHGFVATTYRLFGHSAGGQFVHRLHLFHPNHRADPIIAANPGWYTLPEWGIGKSPYKFPYNTIGSRVDAALARQALSRPFVLMLGTRDTDANDPNLNRSAGAREQGLFRLARGAYFFDASTRAAKELGVNLQWQKKIVDEVGHDNARMAAAAVEMIYSPQFVASRTIAGDQRLKP